MKKHTDIKDILSLVAGETANEIIIFCGAGISCNSGIPIAIPMLDKILDRLGIDQEDKYLLIRPDNTLAMPFEAFMEAFIEHNNDTTLLNIFKLGEPTTNHFFLKKICEKKKVREIYTTNFDLLIEKAFHSYPSLEIDVIIENDIQKVKNTPKTKLIKLHGSADKIETIRTTISSIAHYLLSVEREQIVHQIFSSEEKRKIILILGYSCSDVFDIIPIIEKISDSNKEILYIDHSPKYLKKSDVIVEPISTQIENNPFKQYNGSRIKVHTDSFIEWFWQNIDNNYQNTLQQKKVDWEKIINDWINSLQWEHLKFSIIGHLFYNIPLLHQSMKYNQKALSINGNKDKRGQGASLSNIGLTYYGMEDYKKAFVFFSEALSVFSSINYTFGMVTSLNNIGCSFVREGNKDEAIKELDKALEILGTANFKEKRICEGYVLNSFGQLYYNFEDYDIALDFFYRSLDIYKEGFKLEEGKVNAEIGAVFIKKNKIVDAVKHYNIALDIAKKIGNIFDVQKYQSILSTLNNTN